MRDNSTSIGYVVGARPNFVKVVSVINAMRRRLPRIKHVLIHTGQHYDRSMSDVFIEELGLPRPDYFLEVGSGSHGSQTGVALERIEKVLLAERPSTLVVAGDVNSTLAGALAAAKLGVSVAHVEAGLRSFDWSMPEEINRVIVDRLSKWCFTHSPEAELNLQREGIEQERIYFVGNTMIDALVEGIARSERSNIHKQLGITPGNYVLVTLHRPNLVDGELLRRTMGSLLKLSERVPVVFPTHPRTRARLGATEIASDSTLHVIDPLGYLDFLALEANALAVITDSGGVQEETTFLDVPCFTLRTNTERPITVNRGTNQLIGFDFELINRIPEIAYATPRRKLRPDLWDGRAGERIAEILARQPIQSQGAVGHDGVGAAALW